MLVLREADIGEVVHRLLVLASLACCVLVALSFALFARDQVAGASHHQVRELASAPPTATTPAPVRVESQPRRFIDGAARELTSPFAGIVPSDDAWVQRGVPLLMALAAYGLGLGYLARLAGGTAA